MDPLWLSLVAIIAVIIGVLVLRLHAFLALSFGALLVAILTPAAQLEDFAIDNQASVVDNVHENSRLSLSSGKLASGTNAVFRKSEFDKHYQEIGTVFLGATEPATDETPPTSKVDAGVVTLRRGDRLVHESQRGSITKLAGANAGQRFATGFGDTCRKIGILIAMASVIGTCLLESGAARRIVETTRNVVGERRTPVAFAVSGFVVGIPVFFDTVFYLLMPLARAMRLKTGKNYLLYIMSIVIGATMAHSLVPPTPGPLLVASEIEGVSVGHMIIGGLIVGSIAVAAGFLYCLVANRIWEIPLRDNEAGDSQPSPNDANESDLLQNAPSFFVSLIPILLPVVLLAAKTFTDASNVTPQWLGLLGDKNIALVIAAIAALVMLATRPSADGEATNKKRFDGIGRALASGGLIILITAAGGAFGHVLRQCGIAEAIQSRFPATQNGMMLLCLAFTLTAIVRFAQGSATVSMITSVSIVAPIAAGIALPFHPVYLALAIGCGSKPLPWMNDSGFWIVGRMSGMTEGETLKTFSATLTLMGIVGFLVTLAGSQLLPFVGQ